MASGFAAMQRASEGRYFTAEGNRAVMQHLQKLVEQVPCRLPPPAPPPERAHMPAPCCLQMRVKLASRWAKGQC